MAEKDMVAIHEAMEQQSISISKAGVQATMNARASVLAACNPAEGKYDPSRSLRQNLRLSPTILSRFDLIFVLLDRTCEEDDIRIAKHILGLSMFNPGSTGERRFGTDDDTLRGTLLESQLELKTYVKIARVFRPILTDEAKSILVKSYVAFRQRDSLLSTNNSRMTVRQLESMVRLAEAIAKLHFSPSVTARHAEAAVQIFSNALSKSKKDLVELTECEDEEEEDNDDPAAMGDTGAGDLNKIPVDSSLFTLIQNQLILRLRELMEMLSIATDMTERNGIRALMKKEALIEWHLNENVREVSSEEDRAAERRLISAIVRRMIFNDVLIVESDSLEIEDMRNAILKVHPNIEASCDTRKHKKQPLPTQFYASTTESETSTRQPTVPTVEGSLELQDHEFLSLVYPS
eukprot:Gregarina_sp_Poly_1__1017@NODE_1249_length_4635_cov_154_468914_g850_i0_p1_GENE_NODE_1249_length_4635_cov_154_468914_g850_i0NODE_1249_length_4635_cov_154_468914_g850_i0_p1_ORF_typecomplete_len406_score63_29MCM/PF00493_23/1_1e36MCM_lid/PF17855_1/5_9e24MCM6_C/PF18263_1/1_2e04MCM6_C/PF18263_1/1_2e12Mg_chelatase_C/PF13335_6/0_051Mg_chelatase/PF01078_21/0_083_NODE_1249_length_4635_cov_154_468914_g850_i015642781